MAIDFTKPVVTDNYTSFASEINTAIQNLAMMLDPTLTGTSTNIPTGAKRFNESNSRFERFNGTTWTDAASTFNFPAVSVAGALSVGGAVSGGGFTSLFAAPPAIGSTAQNTGAFTTLSASGAFSAGGPSVIDIGSTAGVVLELNKSLGAAIQLNTNGVASAQISATSTAGGLLFWTGASGSLTNTATLDASGNITANGRAGFGGASLGASTNDALTFKGGASTGYLWTAASRVGLFSASNGTGNGFYAATTANYAYIQTNNTVALTVDGNQNISLGVPPSAWSAGTRAIEVGSLGTAIWNYNQTDSYFTQNAYFGSTWTYASTNAASSYRQSAGQHIWNIAPSGTAGGAITFTQAMTLDNSGNLLVGGTTKVEKLTVTGNIVTNSAQNYIYNNGGSGSSVNSGFFLDGSGSTLRMLTGNAERARIDSSGNLSVQNTIKSVTGGFIFPDGTTQTSAASVSTSSVLNAYAGAAYQGVGTYAFNNGGGISLSPGSNYAGSTVGLSSGTWKCMGQVTYTTGSAPYSSTAYLTLLLRVA